MAGDDVKLFGTWMSLYVLRVKSALDLKAINYEYIEEDLSEETRYLHIFKVPKLLHNGTSIPKSLTVLDYIDKTWKMIPILPEDPEERQSALVWTDEQDKKLQDVIVKAFYVQREEEKVQVVVKVQEILEELDRELCLCGKTFFGGESMAYADLTLGWLVFGLRMWEDVVGFKVMDEKEFICLNYWMGNFHQVPAIRDNLPPFHMEKFFRVNRLNMLALK